MRSPFARLLAAGLLLAAAFGAAAQDYPNRQITLIVPFAAGSGTDAVARIVGQKLSDRLKQPIVVDNKAGASAQIGAAAAAKAAPDGYTLFMTTNTSHSANPSLFQKLPYDPIKDFTPIARVGELPFALVVNPSLPVRNMRELIAYAKANPGKLSYATPNSTSLVATETLKRIAGLDIVGVPYKSSPQAMTDLIANQVQVYVADFGSGLPMMKSDKVRTLGVTPGRPTPLLPGVPPIGEAVPGFDLTSCIGIFGPAGLPAPIVNRINTELQAVMADAEVQAKLAGLGFQVWPSKTPDEFAKYVDDQLKLWTSLIKQAGIRPE